MSSAASAGGLGIAAGAPLASDEAAFAAEKAESLNRINRIKRIKRIMIPIRREKMKCGIRNKRLSDINHAL